MSNNEENLNEAYESFVSALKLYYDKQQISDRRFMEAMSDFNAAVGSYSKNKLHDPKHLASIKKKAHDAFEKHSIKKTHDHDIDKLHLEAINMRSATEALEKAETVHHKENPDNSYSDSFSHLIKGLENAIKTFATAMENFLKSKAKYLYISVPLFSLSVFLENSFKKVFPRHLASTHTHLYTKKSLNYFSKKNNLTVIGEWWFGTDMPDLYRSLINTSSYLNKELYLKELNNKFFLILNELQNILDTNQICSEVHMVFKKTK